MKTRKPTAAELVILRVLWTRGPSTVREVAAELDREDAYTTILKLLQIMTGKGLVKRDVGARTHVYEAVGSRIQTQQQLVADLLDRVFDGSAATLVMHVLEAGTASKDDLTEIRRLLDRYRGGKR